MSTKIATTFVQGVAVLQVSGRLTLGQSSEAFREATRDLIHQGHSKIACLIGEVSYIDSVGLHELVNSFVWASNAEGKLILVGLTKGTKDLLQITKLYTVFHVCETLDEALKAFGVTPEDKGSTA